MYAYIYRFTIDGVEHAATGYSQSIAEATTYANDLMFVRNKNIPGEKTALVAGSLEFGVSEARVMQVLDEVTKKNPNNTTAAELHPGEHNRLLHEPVNPNAELRDISRPV
jgi:hypothetical protein